MQQPSGATGSGSRGLPPGGRRAVLGLPRGRPPALGYAGHAGATPPTCWFACLEPPREGDLSSPPPLAETSPGAANLPGEGQKRWLRRGLGELDFDREHPGLLDHQLPHIAGPLEIAHGAA